MGSNILLFEYEVRWGWNHSQHPETMNGNVKNLSKMIENESKGECHFYFKNLILPFITLRI